MSFARKLEVAANFSILLVAVAIGVVLTTQWWSSRTSLGPSLRAGDVVPIASSDSSAPKELIFVLSTTCHYCNESASFYQHLIDAIKLEQIHLIAVFPQSPQDARTYLQQHGIAIADVRQMVLTSVRGTPTVILANRVGKVQEVWVGKQDSNGENSLLAKVSQ